MAPTHVVRTADRTVVMAWNSYFDQVEHALHEFEVALSRHDVFTFSPIDPPGGRPPESLRRRSEELLRWINELQFRAGYLREEYRAEIARLRPQAARRSDSRVGTNLDING